MATAGKGLPFIGKMNEFLDKMLHPTVQKVGNSRAALDVIHRGYYILNPVPTVPYIVEVGSTDNILVLTAHGAKPGDMIRLQTTANPIAEFEIIIDTVVNANTVTLAGYLSASLTAGDTFFLLRSVSERFAADGSTLASISTPAISYNRRVAGVTTQTSVLEDQDTAVNSRALPVSIRSIDGAGITVNAGDLSVSIDHANDSTKIGDGTRLVAVTVNNELRVKDVDLATQAALLATAARQDLLLTELQLKADLTETQPVSVASLPLPAGAATAARQDLLLTELQLKADLTETQPVSIAGTVAVSGPLTDAQLRATPVPISGTVTANLGTVSGLALNTNIDALRVLTGELTEAAPATDIASSGLNGRLQRIAQNISALIIQLPATLGIKTAALSLSVAPASDAVFGVKPRPLTNQFNELLTLTTVQTFTAPANAIGGKIQALSDNANNVRYAQGGTAAIASGIRLEPGRSEDFNGGSNISVISESGTNAVSVNWTIQA